MGEVLAASGFDVRCAGRVMILTFCDGDKTVAVTLEGQLALGFTDLLGSRLLSSGILLPLADYRP